MSQYYQDLDRRLFDYDLQALSGMPGRLFRGPAVDRSRPYIACIGAAQTFGRFSHQPFPSLLAHRLDIPALNLGVGGAGPRLFDTAPYLDVVNGAALVVLQVLSGRSESNSLFDNSSTGTLRGTRTLDGKTMRFEEFLDELIAAGSPAMVRRVVRETQDNYVRHMSDLLDHIQPPTLLFWFADRSPDFADEFWLMKRFPHIVNRSMVDEIAAHCDGYVECVSTAGIPQILWSADQPVDGAQLEKGVLVNRYYPSPEMHTQAADLLEPACRRLLPARGSRASRPVTAPPEEGRTRFVIVGAERTGSNLLVGLLDFYPDCLIGGELFNRDFVRANQIPGRLGQTCEDPELGALRQSDPALFLSRMFEVAATKGSRAIGFKLLYNHGDNFPAVRDALAADRTIRVIHIKRRNLLRRLLSERRAMATGIWSVPGHAPAPVLPAVHLDLVECVQNFEHVEAKQLEYDSRFAGHEILELFYEDFVGDPRRVAAATTAFLGLGFEERFNLRPRKTGTDPLRKAITNYQELKDCASRWASFFEE